MSFRDDRDALLARADAAAAEADRLRKENERLERELQRARDATPAPAAVAAPGQPPKPWKAPHPPPADYEPEEQIPPGTAQLSPDVLADNALVSRGAELLGAAVIVACCLGGFAVSMKLLVEQRWLVFVAIAICLLIGWMLSLVISDVSRGNQRAWLESLTTVPLPRQTYLALLGVGRVRRRVTLNLWVPSLASARRAEVVDRIREVLPSTQAKWDGERLELKSPTFDTWRANKYGAAFHNAPIHTWFRRAIDDAVLPSLGAARIEHAKIEG